MRKVNVKVTVDLLIRADDGANLDEVIRQWAAQAFLNGSDADVESCEVIDSEVTDSR